MPLVSGSPTASATIVRREDPRELDDARSAQQPAAVIGVAGAEIAAESGAEEERSDRDQRGGGRQALRATDREPEEHDVAGHVRDEHVPELQEADGVHDARQACQQDQQRHQRPVAVAGQRAQRAYRFLERAHAPLSSVDDHTALNLARRGAARHAGERQSR